MITPKIIAITSILVLLIDLIWIKLVMKSEYDTLIYDIQQSEMTVRPISAFLAYTAIILPLLLYTLPNIRPESRITDCIFYGGMLGLLIYGMFSFTNHALIKGWTWRVAISDTVWGFVLYTLVSYIASYFM